MNRQAMGCTLAITLIAAGVIWFGALTWAQQEVADAVRTTVDLGRR